MIKAEWTNTDALDLQPTCNQLATDLISRQDALNLSCEITGWHGDEGVIKACFEAYRDHIKRLPSARPTGEWNSNQACSVCGCQPWYERDIHSLNFCPNCGAKMETKQTLSEADNDTAYGGLMSAT